MFGDNFEVDGGNKIEVQDTTPEALKTFLDVLVLGRPREGSLGERAEGVFKLGHKYGVEAVKAFCAPSLVENIGPGNCLEMLELGYLYESDTVLLAAFQALKDNKKEVMASEGFGRMQANYPKLMNDLFLRFV